MVNLCCTLPPLPPLSLWQVFLQLLLPLLRIASHEALTGSVRDSCINTFLSQLRRWLGDKGLRGVAAVLVELDNGDWQQVGNSRGVRAGAKLRYVSAYLQMLNPCYVAFPLP